MPRDLFASDSDPKDESVVASPDATTPRSDTIDDVNADGSDGYNQFTIQRGEVRKETALQLHGDREIIKKRDNLHPYVQTLSISNLEDCVALEDAVFPEHERCSREKVERIFDYSLHLAWQFFQPLTLMHETSSRKGFTYHQLLNLYLDHCYSLENGCEATGFLRTLSVFNVFLSEAVTMLRYPTTLEETVLSEVLNQQLHVCPLHVSLQPMPCVQYKHYKESIPRLTFSVVIEDFHYQRFAHSLIVHLPAKCMPRALPRHVLNPLITPRRGLHDHIYRCPPSRLRLPRP